MRLFKIHKHTDTVTLCGLQWLIVFNWNTFLYELVEKVNFLFLWNMFTTWAPWTSLRLPFSQHTRTHMQAHTFDCVHTYAHRLRDISQALWLWVSSLFHFHSPVSSFSRLSCSFPPPRLSPLFPFPALLFFIFSLHRSLYFCFSFKFPAFLSASRSLSYQPTPARSVSLPQASCVYISVVYFYKCQTAFLPSVYWSTERGKEMERQRERERLGEKRGGQRQGTDWKERYIGGWREWQIWEKSGMRWEKEG